MAKRIDGNHFLIVRDLRKAGAVVQSLAEIGKGCGDILVGYKGKNYVFEIKDPIQKPSAQRLTPAEQAWHALWKTGGQVDVIRTSVEALRIIGAIK
jgi:hypothetical protein